MPDALKQAQAAIDLPEVQEILKKLSACNLGVCMPHMHNDATGDFEALPDGVVQVETDLRSGSCTRKNPTGYQPPCR